MKKQEKLLKILEGIDLEYDLDTGVINRQKLNEVIGGILLCHRNTTSSWIHSLIGLGILEHNPRSQLITPKSEQYARAWFEPRPKQIIMPTLNTKYRVNVEKLTAKIAELRKEKCEHTPITPSLLSYSVVTRPDHQEVNRDASNE